MPEPTPSQKEMHDIFHREDYFYCTRERCSMRKTLCIEYQRQSQIKVKTSYVVGFNTSIVAAARYKCKSCDQGKGIKQELKEKGII